jgi:hypothetical protein
MSGSRQRRGGLIATLLVVILTFGWGALAADPTPTPAPSPTPTPAPPQTLADLASQTSLQHGGTAAQKGIVITNENLAGYASKGTLTEVKTSSNTGSKTPTSQAAPQRRPAHSSSAQSNVSTVDDSSEEREEEAKKAYWRTQYQQQTAVIDAIRKAIEKLDFEIPGLWNQFYSWDDPAYRDGVIKVNLDQAVAKREELAQQLPAEEERLTEILEEARRDGALPGWFRGLR